jgi:putative GTP pyrophosphokinase
VTTVDSGAPSSATGPAHPLLSPRTLELLAQTDSGTLSDLTALRDEISRFLMRYRFGIAEVETKLNILRDEFSLVDGYNPIERISCRVKSIESVLEKADRKGIDLDLDAIRQGLSDIAGVRVVCSFVSDVYRIVQLLTSQDDITVLQVKDYIAQPKPNGYRSLHVILEVPVFLSGGAEPVRVEVQFRTIAMDFWASLEHKTYYKYETQVPQHLIDGLTDAAETAAHLDATMEQLHLKVRSYRPPAPTIAI